MQKSHSRNNSGFTIVELLVVIVVIGILAAITIVSYAGISQRAIAASLQSDLANAQKQILIYQTENDVYPGEVDDCPTPADGNLCVDQSSSDNSFTNYSVNNAVNPPTFSLDAVNGSTIYRVTNNSGPAVVALDPADWITIGTQVWAKANLNVGTMITGATSQTDNETLEKYCFGDNEANCTTYGGLYQWDEAMQYVTTASAQGICPTGSHIPSDNDIKILEMQLGMTQEQADVAYAWRGTDQGLQMKPDGSSGLDMPLAGSRDSDGVFDYQTLVSYLWSSSEYSVGSNQAWYRALHNNNDNVYRSVNVDGYGLSVRCIGN